MRLFFANNTYKFFVAVIIAAIGGLPGNAFAYPTHTLTNGQWSLISLPADPGSRGTIRALFEDDLPADNYGSSWVIYKLDTPSGAFEVVPLDEPLTPHTGYWAIQVLADTVEIDIPDSLAPLTGSAIDGCIDGKSCTSHPLVSSSDSIVWNLVGYSSDTEHLFGESRFLSSGDTCTTGCSPEEALQANIANSILYRYNAANPAAPYETVDQSTVMQPWDGYWLAMLPDAESATWVLPVGELDSPENPDNPDEPVEPANVAPIAVDDLIGPLDAGASLTFSVTANDADSDGDLVAASVSIVDAPGSGTATVAADGLVTYTHNGSADTNSDTFTYTVIDDDGAVSNTATVSITPINNPEPENTAPVAVNDTVGPLDAGETLTFAVIENDADEDGNVVASSVDIIDPPFSGTATVDADGMITYTHDGALGTESDTLTYTVQDDDGAVSNVATVTLTPINDPEPEDPTSEPTIGPASLAEAAAFLNQATFGATNAEAMELQEMGSYAAWIENQLDERFTPITPKVTTVTDDNRSARIDENQSLWVWLEQAVTASDQLRLRASYALSQVFSTSTNSDLYRRKSQMHATYKDVITRNTFGNFRDLLNDVTFNLHMGQYLTYLYNEKADPDTGSMPDENYAREIMQLFTIGLKELNIDGTPKIQNGAEIETYTLSDIRGLAKVFTGIGAGGTTWGRTIRIFNREQDLLPMVINNDHHSTAEKSFLGVTIPANTRGEESIAIALDTLYNHSNTGPFIATLLIKQLTTSNPSPRYVESVATAFNNGTYQSADGITIGNGVRGDMRAVWAAILLDSAARNPNRDQDDGYGKVRDQNLRFLHWARIGEVRRFDLLERFTLENIGQNMPYRAPSVFSFFSPNFRRSGSITASNGLTAPELQIAASSGIISYINTMRDYVERDADAENYAPQYTALMAIADDPEELVSQLNTLLTGGRMEPATVDGILATVNEIPLPQRNNGQARRNRVIAAVGLTVTSIEFMTSQ